ncbi:MAG TPA: nuclear transport factor 2 family protein [Acidobacteriaceae bacterium]|nr:nuclear transport factor 2 family protein [Acidobacteriaceae bacterium]
METFSLPIQSAFAHAFVQDWADSWNTHDLDRILSHYADDVVLLSPLALKLLNNATAIVQGKSALRNYFQVGLKTYPNLHFTLMDVLWGIETIVAYYGTNVRESKTAEVMQFNPAGKVIRVFANYNQ